MSPLNRYLTRPLVFAALAIATVVAVGEPVQEPSVQVAPLADAEPVMSTLEAESAPSAQRADRASRLRWLITLPSARKPCCRGPV